MNVIITINLVCVLFDPAIPTSSFNFIVFYTCNIWIASVHLVYVGLAQARPNKLKLPLQTYFDWQPPETLGTCSPGDPLPFGPGSKFRRCS